MDATLPPSSVRGFREKLLGWYKLSARTGLPWRQTRDAYAVWISEAMLQQTQVATVIPYFERFLRKFPTVHALADAPVTDVLDAWSGLGYYSRAHNLHAAAKQVVREHGGSLPDDVELLQRLPGIGRYTAGAVASIAYGRPAPILDANVIRLLSRYFALREDPAGPAARETLWGLAARLVPEQRPGDFNQAMMELGALVCLPRRPECGRCPLRRGCGALKLGLQEQLPVKAAKSPRKKIRYLCGLLRRDGRLLLARRPLSGLLPGLWEFPGGEAASGEPAGQALARLLDERLRVRISGHRRAARVRQVLSHRELEIEALECDWKGRIAPSWYVETRWFAPRELRGAALTSGMARVAGALEDP